LTAYGASKRLAFALETVPNFNSATADIDSDADPERLLLLTQFIY